MSFHFFIARLGLLLQSCFAAGLACLARWLIWREGPLSTTIELSVLTMFIAASVFVLSILMGGVMADFKDAERIPADISSSFDAMLSQVLAFYQKREKPASRAATLASLRALAAWLLATARLVDGSGDYAAAAAARHEAETALLAETISSGAWNTSFAGWALAVGGRLSRMRVIEATSFYLPAYTLYDSLTLVVFILLLITRHSSAEMAFLVTAVFSLLFFYLACLVRALDSPFVYPDHHHLRKVVRAFGASEALRGLASEGGGGVAVLDVGGRLKDTARVGTAGLNSIDFDVLFEEFAARLVAAVERVAGE